MTNVDLTAAQKLSAINEGNSASRVNSIFTSLILNTNASFEETQLAIDNINSLLATDDITLDQLQEVVNFIKANKTDLENLAIDNISGLTAALESKQDNLISGTTIKTLNGLSLLGAGNLTISGNWGGITGAITDQTDLKNALDAKQDKLISTTNIKSIGGVTLLGGGDLVLSSDALGTTTQWGLA